MGVAIRPELARVTRAGRLRAAVDWSHPLASRLQSCILADGRCGVVDLAKPRAGSSVATALRSRGPSASTWSISAGLTTDLNFTSGFTAACVVYVNQATNTGNPQIFGRFAYTDEATNAGWCITQNSGVFGTLLMNNNGFGSYLQTGSASSTVGVHTVGFSADGTTKRIYVDGALDASTTSGNQTAATGSGAYVNALNASSQANGTEVLIGCVWSRVLSAAEMMLFHQDPLCLLKQRYILPPIVAPSAPVFNRGRMFAMFPP